MDKSEAKLKSLTIQEKAAIVDLIENGKSIKDVSKELEISKNTLHYIYKQKEKIRQELLNKPENSSKKRIKQIKCPELEEGILSWMFDAKERGEKITGSQIKSFALELANSMAINQFSGSNGWLCSFFKRHNIVLSEFNGNNECRVQLIKPKKSLDTSETWQYSSIDENIEYIHESPREKNIEDENIEEILKEEEEEVLAYTAEWKNWCRLCSSTTNQMLEYCPRRDEVVQVLFNLEPNVGIKICNDCQSKIQEINKFMEKGKEVDSMFNEFEELERQNILSDEMVLKIRAEYGFEVDELVIFDDTEIESSNNQIELDPGEEFIYEELENVGEMTIVDSQEEHQENIKEEFVEGEVLMVSSTSRIDESEYDFTCHICNQSFDKMFFLTNHTREQHSCLPQVACVTCGKYLATWDSILSHRRKHSSEEPQFECLTCGAKFVTQTGLSIHIKIKHSKDIHVKEIVKKYICQMCDREFKDGHILKSHMRVHLSDEEKYPYKCDTCEKRLANKYSLKHHISTVHEHIKSIQCHLCTKSFSNRSNLRSHLISHTTENVKCPVCDMNFKNRVSLQSHKKLHKENSRKFACPECGKLFFNRHHLQRHRIAHTEDRNFKCNLCDMAYKWEKDLKNHIDLHCHQENNTNYVQHYTCDCCDRKFTTANNLKKHISKCHQNMVIEEIVTEN